MPLSRSSQRYGFVALIIAFAITAGCKKESKKSTEGDTNPPPVNPNVGGGGGGNGKGGTGGGGAPAGWCEARDAVGGYRVYIPGDKAVAPDFSKAGGQETRPTGCYAAIPNPAIKAEVRTFSLLPATGVKLGATPDELFAGLKAFNRAIDSHYDVEEKTSVTLGGKPAIKVVLKTKPSNRPKSSFDNDPEFAKMRAEEAERDKKDQAKRQVYYVTSTAMRIVLIQVDTPGNPDPAILKTVTESFAFL